jgi:hypothetical protein
MFNRRGLEDNQKDGIKEAFDRVKTDIFNIGNELFSFKNELFDIKNQLSNLNELLNNLQIELLSIKNPPQSPISTSNTPTHIPTDEPKYPTDPVIPTDNPTVPCEVGGLKSTNLSFSTRNRGVPTDKQTNQQTDNPTDISFEKEQKTIAQHIQEASEILDSLDNLKKEIRLKFKNITQQEMLVFSTIYQLEEQFPEGVEYKQIAAKLKLSEFSIRDYTQKLMNKGIPIEKLKLNNKKILLKISPELKKIASLDTLIRLRSL